MTDKTIRQLIEKLVPKSELKDPLLDLSKTSERVEKSFADMLSGYQTTLESLGVTTFPIADDVSDIVTLSNIEFSSVCAHHLLPFSGVATVGYTPKNRIIGLSKIPRIVDMYSKRLQVQERLNEQIVTALRTVTESSFCFAILTCRHECVACRGVTQRNIQAKTVFWLGSTSVDDVGMFLKQLIAHNT